MGHVREKIREMVSEEPSLTVEEIVSRFEGQEKMYARMECRGFLNRGEFLFRESPPPQENEESK